ncbi:MAG: right-handed parallel beta-helix repeat-containing protein [Gaiellaceae bacterium]
MRRLAALAALVLAAATGCGSNGDGPEGEGRLAAGLHRGPIELTAGEELVGEAGAVVRGGIRIRGDGVTVRGVSVTGGLNGIDVDESAGVVLDGVRVSGARLDGIHVRRSSVTIRNCRVDTVGNPWGQGIDISFSFDRGESLVEGCTLLGGREGIVTHSSRVRLRGNRVRDTTLRGIAVTEMSLGQISGNRVDEALGVGIFCGDRSQCAIVRNSVTGTRPDPASGDLTRMGYAIQAHFGAQATLRRNTLVGNARGTSAFFGASLRSPP